MIALPKSENLKECGDKSAAQPSKPLVLIIENHEDTRRMLSFLLTNWNYRVAEAADGEQGLRLAEQCLPELILTDAMLPLLDGLAIVGEVRRRARLKEVPIVFLSGRAEPSFRESAIRAGADEYLVKPLGLQHLETALAAHIGKKHGAANNQPNAN